MLMRNENIAQAFPLAMAGERDWVKIVGITGGKKLTKRLIAMGLIEDMTLQVLQRQKGMGLIVTCGETRLALNMGVANKMRVIPVQED
ncbi:FeoA family protein [Candidatus Parabeggiatoa sp. HSG14]|uniref:FeoA family protein n=1 Tax=Candidatus Parabeggiatoa sp. HSG14 TaxID=3055593 RepID=UPI0025A846D5|nr:FeoA family protein [Thiotrichales bacterium HSG14]